MARWNLDGGCVVGTWKWCEGILALTGVFICGMMWIEKDVLCILFLEESDERDSTAEKGTGASGRSSETSGVQTDG